MHIATIESTINKPTNIIISKDKSEIIVIAAPITPSTKVVTPNVKA